MNRNTNNSNNCANTAGNRLTRTFSSNPSTAFSLVLLVAFLMFSASCASDREGVAPEIDARDAFFDNIAALCGSTLLGASTFPENDDHPLVGTELRNEITYCDDEMIRIELIRDGDYWHGAWVLERRDDGLHLFHDHLGAVRTMEQLTARGDSHGYGGYATTGGTAFRQYFPADAVTAEMIPAAATNVWMMELDPENGTFIYNLERHEQPRFRAVMHLKSPD